MSLPNSPNALPQRAEDQHDPDKRDQRSKSKRFSQTRPGPPKPTPFAGRTEEQERIATAQREAREKEREKQRQLKLEKFSEGKEKEKEAFGDAEDSVWSHDGFRELEMELDRATTRSDRSDRSDREPRARRGGSGRNNWESTPSHSYSASGNRGSPSSGPPARPPRKALHTQEFYSPPKRVMVTMEESAAEAAVQQSPAGPTDESSDGSRNSARANANNRTTRRDDAGNNPVRSQNRPSGSGANIHSGGRREHRDSRDSKDSGPSSRQNQNALSSQESSHSQKASHEATQGRDKQRLVRNAGSDKREETKEDSGAKDTDEAQQPESMEAQDKAPTSDNAGAKEDEPQEESQADVAKPRKKKVVKKKKITKKTQNGADQESAQKESNEAEQGDQAEQNAQAPEMEVSENGNQDTTNQANADSVQNGSNDNVAGSGDGDGNGGDASSKPQKPDSPVDEDSNGENTFNATGNPQTSPAASTQPTHAHGNANGRRNDPRRADVHTHYPQQLRPGAPRQFQRTHNNNQNHSQSSHFHNSEDGSDRSFRQSPNTRGYQRSGQQNHAQMNNGRRGAPSGVSAPSAGPSKNADAEEEEDEEEDLILTLKIEIGGGLKSLKYYRGDDPATKARDFCRMHRIKGEAMVTTLTQYLIDGLSENNS